MLPPAGMDRQAGKVVQAGRHNLCSKVVMVTHASGVTGQTADVAVQAEAGAPGGFRKCSL